jgi:hypothetical protein
MRYKKIIGDLKNIENDFYTNKSPNDDLERFRKVPGDRDARGLFR